MPRPLRIEYENAFYHVMNRGRDQQTIFHDDQYYGAFLDTIVLVIMEKGKKSLEIMDVNPNSTKRILRRYGVKRLIHGHTHRPKIHEIDLDGETAHRFVLAQWEEQGSVLSWKSDGYRIETFD